MELDEKTGLVDAISERDTVVVVDVVVVGRDPSLVGPVRFVSPPEVSLAKVVAGVDWSTTGTGLSVCVSVTAAVAVVDERVGSELLAESCADTNVSLDVELTFGAGVVSIRLASDVELG